MNAPSTSFVFAATLLSTCVAAQDVPFPTADPESVGMSSERLRQVVDRIQGWVEAGDVVGAEILIVKNRRTVLHEGFGFRDREDDVPFERGTICRIRSMTKPFVGTAIHMLAQEGKLGYGDPVAKFIPAFDNDKSGEVTIGQLLVHEGGFAHPGFPEPLHTYGSLRDAVDAVGKAGPETSPGTHHLYSDAGSSTLGAIVAQISGMPVEDFIAQRILEPLALPDTFCALRDDDPRRARVSSTYLRTDEGGYEKYWDSDDPQRMPFFRACGGMYSTPVDYARFLSLWMDEGAAGDISLLFADNVHRALVGTAASAGRYAQHWQIFGLSATQPLPVFGHSGSDGTIAMADPARDVIVCYFTQSRRGPTLSRIADVVRQAIPETTSLAGEPLFAPMLSDEARSARTAQLAEARMAYARNPVAVDTLVWFGRRTAYLGHYAEAAGLYTFGLRHHGDQPHLLRHRGHRFISLRRFDDAIADLSRAASLIAGQEDEVEPDGMPNARNIPTSTLQFNIWYHLGLARYLKGDFEGAADAYAECMKVSNNPDARCATTHWYYMTLRRLGRDDEAAALLEPITADMDVIENTAYHHLALMYKGARSEEDVMGGASGGDGIQNATAAYGVANWHHYNGREEQAKEIYQRIVEGQQWAAFGHIAAEVELYGR